MFEKHDRGLIARGAACAAELLVVAMAVASVAGLGVLSGCGSGTNKQIVRNAPNRPPFIADGTIQFRGPIIGTLFDDVCSGMSVEGFIPTVEVTFPIIDLEDPCGEMYLYYSTNNGLTYQLATESSFREAGLSSPDCGLLPMTSFCAPCQPMVPLGQSSSGAMALEPDNHALPTCMTAAGGGQFNRFNWDVFADGIGFPDPSQVVFCIVPTDPSNPLPSELLRQNTAILENPGAQTDQIAFDDFNRLLRTVPTTPGFFCSPTIQVRSPFTRVGIDDTDITQIRVGSLGFDFEVPVRIVNENAGGPTCFYVGIQYDPTHLNFRYFSSSDFAMGIPATNDDLVQGTPLLLFGSGTVEIVSPAPAAMTGAEDFIVLRVTSPQPLVGGNLFELLWRANPPPPSLPGMGPSVLISLIEPVPVSNAACIANPASCNGRADWEVPSPDYTGVTNGGLGAVPCDGIDYPFVADPPVAITCIENFPPECCIKPSEGADFRNGNLAIDYFLSDREEDIVFITPEFSTDSGMTWSRMTEDITDPLTEGTLNLLTGAGLPCPAAPTAMDRPCGIATCVGDWLGAREHFFVWDITTDLPPGSGFVCEIQVRITPDDGASVGTGCITIVPTFLQGPDLIVRRADDLGYRVDNVISTAGGGRPIILPELPAFENIRVFALGFNGEEIDVTDSITFVSSDPQVIDVIYDPAATPVAAARVENDPQGLVPGTRPLCEIGNQCVLIDMTFTGFVNPPQSACPLGIFDPVTGMDLTQLVGQIAACTDLGGPDYSGDRATHMALGDFDAEIPGLPSGPVVPGMGGSMAVTFYTDVETRDLGAYSVNLDWETAALTFASIFASPIIQNMTPNTTQAMASPIARLEWNNFTIQAGLNGVLELETVNFQVACGTGPCATSFIFSVDTLVDQGGVGIGTFIGGNADSATDCSAEFTVP